MFAGSLRLVLPAIVCVTLGCSSERDRDRAPTCTTWQEDLAATVDDRCGSCHGDQDPEGDYDLTSYLGALSGGTDETANAIAGDDGSRILEVLDPATADATHAPFADLVDSLRDWVVTCELAYSRSDIHDPGIMNPADPEFHGTILAGRFAYDFAVCADCHGDDFAGGRAGAACTTCHTDGPTDCSTCHGPMFSKVAAAGAHGAHLASPTLARPLDCSNCHTVPDAYDDVGHIFLASGELDPAPVEVAFSAAADRLGTAAYDPATGTCSGVYCHAPNPNDSVAELPAPTWMDRAEPLGCGSCHGNPPSTHADDRCGSCHQQVITATGELTPTLHLDGEVQIGRTTADDCSSCHGTVGGSAAPPTDLAGNSARSFVTVGAHAAHVLGPRRLRGPIPCSDCHREPTALDDSGHIDSAGPAEVFPGGASFPGLAAARGATPVWDRTSATCSGVYCHGDTTPLWTATAPGEAACGTCHGIPPASHNPALTLSDCASCHPRTVDAFGNILVTGDPPVSQHLDGEVDVP